MSTDPIIQSSGKSSGKSPGVEPRKVAIASASSPVNLGVLGGGTLGTVALVLAGHPMLGIMVLALGVLAYGALVGLDMFNPKFIHQVYEQSDPDAASLSDHLGALQTDMQVLETKVEETIKELPP